ncbi:hypothetical protein ACG98H_06070 [Corynebacterium sp. L4756]
MSTFESFIMDTSTTPRPQRSRFGRSKYGGTSTALMVGSFAAGLVVSVAIATVLWAIIQPPESTALYLGVFTLCLFPVAMAASWAFLVDRNTIRGATENPENSIESTWYDNAAQSTFHIILVAIGALGVASVFTDIRVTLGTVAIASYVFILVTFAASYQLFKRRDS